MKSLLDRSFTKSLITAFIIAIAFLTYMYFIGIPKTQAAGFFNMAQRQEAFGAKKEAQRYYELALEAFQENYIQREYERFLTKNYLNEAR